MKLATIVAVAQLVGCKSDASPPPAPPPTSSPVTTPALPTGVTAPATAGGTLSIAPPPATEPNLPDDLPGFHDAAGTIQLYVVEETMEIDEVRAAIEPEVKDWVKSERTADGWVLAWARPKRQLFPNDELREVGIDYEFRVQGRIEGAPYTCYGTVAAVEQLEEMIARCSRVTRT